MKFPSQLEISKLDLLLRGLPRHMRTDHQCDREPEVSKFPGLGSRIVTQTVKIFP